MVTSTTRNFAVETRCRRLEGQVALVTGGAQGLGRVIARRFAEEGASVVIADVQAARALRAAESLTAETGSQLIAVGGDLAEEGVSEKIVDVAIENFGRLDILVNNAAALIRQRLVDFDEEMMQESIRLNVWTALRPTKAALRPMLEQNYGRIVMISGEALRLGSPFHTMLAGVGKGSLLGLTSTLAGEVIADGITVNCVSPGGFNSRDDGDPDRGEALSTNPRWTPPEVMEAIGKRVASNVQAGMGRLGHPTEIAAAVAFFASPEASFVTGQHLSVSGGLTML